MVHEQAQMLLLYRGSYRYDVELLNLTWAMVLGSRCSRSQVSPGERGFDLLDLA